MNHMGVTDLVCFSHLRWDFVYQRPQHLMTRFAKHFRVIFIEEPVPGNMLPGYSVSSPLENFIRIVPHVPTGLTEEEVAAGMKEILVKVFQDLAIHHYFFWYCTPMALDVTGEFEPALIVYDCMDELSAFKSAPQTLKELERGLLQKADIVFTGGLSLYEARKHLHTNMHVFPNSIDAEHFYKARYYSRDPDDQASIPYPRIGFFGVIDERVDFTLLYSTAIRKPAWHFIMIGPVVKIEEKELPRLPNIHYLGRKEYVDLPSYIAGWDIAMLPFAHNDSTRYISPAKTPEYLAAGKPVISTPINDVIRQFAHHDLVHIAGTADEFIRVAELELERRDRSEWLQRVNDFLSHNSWDKTCQCMLNIISVQLTGKLSAPTTQDNITTQDNVCV
jgi:glycosyltransferase involved in cell wall biosynthesis